MLSGSPATAAIGEGAERPNHIGGVVTLEAAGGRCPVRRLQGRAPEHLGCLCHGMPRQVAEIGAADQTPARLDHRHRPAHLCCSFEQQVDQVRRDQGPGPVVDPDQSDVIGESGETGHLALGSGTPSPDHCHIEDGLQQGARPDRRGRRGHTDRPTRRWRRRCAEPTAGRRWASSTCRSRIGRWPLQPR